MTDVVTRLIVRADGSLATLDQFEKGMGDAGKATDYASGAVASFEKRMEAARAATERGLAVSTQTVARKSQEERAWEKWSSTVDRTTGLRIRLEREAATAAAAAANAVNLGYASQEQALNTLMALERRHTAQLSAHIAAENNVAIAYNRTAQAADHAAVSTARLSAANQNSQYRGASNFNTANVAAQFQDIGVTAVMGMSPLQIALQQGTQLSAVLGGQGLTGVVKTLGAAFASILSPVSLLTIGVVALAAWGIQAFMSMSGGADDATDALADHKAALDKLLVGYEAAGKAADDAFDAAQRAPEGVVSSDLRASLREQEEAATGLQRRIEANRAALAETATFLRQIQDVGSFGMGADDSAGVRQIDLMRQLAIDATASEQALEDATVAARELYNTSDDPAIREMADQAYQLAVELMGVRAQAASAQAALAALNNMDIQVSIQASTDEAISAIERITRLAPELRSARQQATDALNEALGSAPDAILRQAAQQQYSQTIAALDEQDRRREAERAGKAGGKTLDQWGGNVESFQQRIAAQQMEIDLMGKSTFEVERQKAAFDLLNQAKQAGIPITSEVTNQINLMSSEYATATVELERQAEAQRAAEEQMNFYRSAFVGFFGDLKSGLQEGQSFWEALGNAGANALDKIADKALSMAANGIFDMIFGAVMGGLTGGFGGGMGNGLFGTSSITGSSGGFFPGFANGTPYAPGGLSWVGERGPELVSLPRGSQVFNHQQSMGLAANSNRPISVQTNIINNAGVEVVERTVEDGQGGVRQEIILNRAIASAVAKPGPAQKAVRSTGQLVRR